MSELVRAQHARGIQAGVVRIDPTETRTIWLTLPDASPVQISFRDLVREAKGFDALHVHQISSFAFDAAALLRQLGHVPLVLTDHGGGWPTPSRLFGRSRLRLVDGIGAVSPWSLSRLTGDRRWARPAEILWGGGDHVVVGEPTGTHIEKHYDFLFVGRLLPHKGVHVLIDALPAQATLGIAGEARDPQYRRDLQRAAQGKAVEFLGSPSDDDLAQIYRSTRFTVLPSVDAYRDQTFRQPELLGLTLLESLNVGTPVVGSDLGGMADLLSAVNMPSAPSGDVGAWKALLVELLRNPQPQVRGADKFTWDATAGRAQNLYGMVASSR